jgi:type I restriction enzyme, S subunit
MTESKDNSQELPKSWIWTTIGEIAKTASGGTPSRKKSDYYGGTIPWVKSGELNDSYINSVEEYITDEAVENSSAKIFPKNTTLVALYGATVGKTAILGIDAATNQAVCAIFPKADSFVSNYMSYWLRSRRQSLIELSIGGAQPNISQGILQSFQFPLAPIPEQYRIVARIEELFIRLDAGVEALQKAQTQLQRYRQSVLKAAVEGRLTEEWRKAHPDVEPAEKLLEKITKQRKDAGKESKYTIFSDSSGLSEIPDIWTWATIEQLRQSDRTIAYGVLQPGPDVVNGVPLIRVGDIDGGKVIMDNIKRIDPKIAAKYKRTKLMGGEVLITLVGAIGRTAVVPDSLVGANTARAVGVIPLSNFIRSSWVEIWFRNPDKIFEMTSKAHEVARKTLNLEDVRSAQVAVPPLAEQNEIINEVESRLSLAENAEIIINLDQRRCEKLRQGILKCAFEGKLVPQDLNDEPALVLLDRIRSERVKGSQRKGGRIKRNNTQQMRLSND